MDILLAVILLITRLVLVWLYVELSKKVMKASINKWYKVAYLAAICTYLLFALLSSLTGFDNVDYTRLIPIVSQAMMVWVIDKLVDKLGG